MTPEQLEELTAWARKLQTESDAEDVRAAARAILMLADEVARLSRPAPPASDDDAPPPPSEASRALADRLRLGRRADEDPVRESHGLEPDEARIPRGATPRLDTA